MMKSLADLFAEHEAEVVAKAKAEIAAEDAAWAALTPEQQAAHHEAVAAKWAALEMASADDGTDDETSDEDQGDDA